MASGLAYKDNPEPFWNYVRNRMKTSPAIGSTDSKLYNYLG